VRKTICLAILICATRLSAQVDCSSYNYRPAPFVERVTGAEEHIWGVHQFDGSISASCTYNGGTGPCNVDATVSPTATMQETGDVFGFCHKDGTNTASQQASATNGLPATAQGAVAGEVRTCLFCGCTAHVGITFPINFTFDPDNIWRHGQSKLMTCAGRTGVPAPPPPYPRPPVPAAAVATVVHLLTARVQL